MGKALKLHDIGLPQELEDILFCQGRVDKVTRQGALIVKSEGKKNDNGSLKNLNINYWFRLPTNDAPAKSVSLIKIEATKSGAIKSVRVAGRPVDHTNPDTMRAVRQTVRDIHAQLIKNRLPNMAQIFKDNDLHRLVGESITIYGQKTVDKMKAEAKAQDPHQGGLDFRDYLYKQSAEKDYEDLKLPRNPVMMRALLGLYSNSATPAMTMPGGTRIVMAAHGPTRKDYQNKFTVSNDNAKGDLKIKASLRPVKSERETEPTYYPRLVEVFTKSARDDDENRHRINRLVLANENLDGASNTRKMEAIGAINGMFSAAAMHTAPMPLKHLAEYNLTGLVARPPRIEGDDTPRLNVTSLFGNNLTKVYGDMGGGLGCCNKVEYDGISGFHDLGMEPAPDGSEISCSIPYLDDFIDDAAFVAVTHRHIDHAGAFPYQIEKLAGKDVLCTPQVYEAIKDGIRTVHGTKTNDYMRAVNWVMVDKPMTKTYSNDGGRSGLTVISAPNIVPHSAYGTPFYYASFYTDKNGHKKIQSVYTNIGDVRSEDKYDEDGNINERFAAAEEFFGGGWRKLLKAAHDDLPMREIPRYPTYAEWDSTSVRHTGKSPTRNEIRKNLQKLSEWSEGKTILQTHLASSDNMMDIVLDCAARAKRDVTMFGKNIEVTQRIQNIFGYTEITEPWAQGHQNQIYMDSIFAGDHEKELAKHDRKTVQAIQNDINQHVIEDAFDIEYSAVDDMSQKQYETYREEFRKSHTDQDVKNLEFYYDIKRLSRRIGNRNEKLATKLEVNKNKFSDEDIARETEKVEALNEKDQAVIDASHLYLAQQYYIDQEQENHAAIARLLLVQNLHGRLGDYAANNARYNKREEFADLYDIPPHDMGGIVITRNTLTSLNMFADHLDKMWLYITGSQGNEVEIEAQLYKILENRALLQGEDPEFRHTARPIDKENTVLINSQSAIPGNEKSRRNLIYRAVNEHGFTVFDSTQSGYELWNPHHMGEGWMERVEDDLAAMDVRFDPPRGPHKKIVVPSGMAIGYKGHGRADDIAELQSMVGAEMNGAQHVNNPEFAEKIRALALANKLGAMDELIQDGVVLDIDRLDERKAVPAGKIPRGITLIKTDHPYQKPFRPVILTESFKILEADGCATHLNGLMAGAPPETLISQVFGQMADPEKETRLAGNAKGEPRQRAASVDIKPENRHPFTPRLPTSGAKVPGSPASKKVKLG